MWSATASRPSILLAYHSGWPGCTSFIAERVYSKLRSNTPINRLLLLLLVCFTYFLFILLSFVSLHTQRPNTNICKLFLEECPSTTNNGLVCRISDELLTHGWGLQPPWKATASCHFQELEDANLAYCWLLFGKTSSGPVGHRKGFPTKRSKLTLTADYLRETCIVLCFRTTPTRHLAWLPFR